MFSAPRTIGNAGHPECTAITPGGISCKPDGRFMTEGVQGKDVELFDLAKQGQREIPGNTENFTGTIVFQRLQQGMCEFHVSISPF